MKFKIPDIINDKISKYSPGFSHDEIIKSCDSNDMEFESSRQLLANLELVNNIKRINKFHRIVNKNLITGGFYISCAETIPNRKIRLFNNSPYFFRSIIIFIDFIYNRLIPKLPIFKQIYFYITKGKNRVLSKTEALGRIVSCGFNIVEYFENNNLLYIIAEKSVYPSLDTKPSYGVFFKMNRVAYKGKMVGFYKIRTMYPYSEFCQELIDKENKIADSGKFNNDFRITYWGKYLRKFWIDELPMIMNFFKGEINLVGVRPLSKKYFLKYPVDLQELRIEVKPGLIPPYYSDMPSNFDEILESERKYLKRKIKSPILTDMKYFFKAIFNIFIKGARSN